MEDDDQIKNKLVNQFSDGNADEIAQGLIVKADTLEELAEKLGGSMDPEILKASIDAYNKAYDEGRDADYGRPFSSMTPVRKPPFYALELGPTMYNTQGGPHRNCNAQVLDPNGDPIPGLFSCGEMGSMFCDMYNGGGNLGECAIYGRIAGHNAAQGLRGVAPAPTTTIFNVPTATGSSVIEEKLVETSGSYKPGTYEASAQGMGGLVTVKVTFSETEITDVVIEGPNETPGYGDKAVAAMPEQILKAQSADVDGVSGASITSRAIRQAVSDCIEQASVK
ncbi:MAG: FMN-binding protein [Clostridia bacterium]|nr:FMN-binding protein [Clostridia bacterium]